MSRNYILWTSGTLKLGPVATALDYGCQVTSAAISLTANTVEVPGTACDPAPATVVNESSATLSVAFLQDWGATNSLSQYLWDNEGTEADFELDGIGISGAPQKATGTVTVAAGAFGGEVGSAVLTATADLPCLTKPTIAAGVVLLAADEEAA